MKKIFFLFLIVLLIYPVNASIEALNYTDTQQVISIVEYPNSTNETITFITANDNEIYSIDNLYKFSDSLLMIDEGTYYNNLTFNQSLNKYKIVEKYIITDGFLCKNVKRRYIIFINGIEKDQNVIDYKVYSTSPYFSRTEYTFLINEVTIENKYISVIGQKTKKNVINLDYSLMIDRLEQSGNLNKSITLTYTKVGQVPKSYYVNKLHPVLKYPYKLIQVFDTDNFILNILTIVSYFLRAFFFWIVVLYQSLFIILILILAVIIPYISMSKSRNPKQFINTLFYNYDRFFRSILKIMRYLVDLIIKLIQSLPLF